MSRLKNIVARVAGRVGALNFYHLFLAWAASVFYRRPSRRMKVVGVTGTKGKSTVVEMIDTILKSSGEKVVVSSSHKIQVGNRSWENKTGNSMPGRGFIQKLLRDGLREGCKYGVVEVVSEGVVQSRHRFIDFDVAVFTGLHPEHIESHGGYEKYRDAKLKFFTDVKKHSKKENKRFVINKNGAEGDYFYRAIGGEVSFYEKYNGKLSVIGEFNKENAAAAAEVARILGIDERVIEESLAGFGGVPGRMQFVQKEPFRVVVDYAHTPGSLEAAYSALNTPGKKLICVFGSDGGGRDKWKRPKMGEIAEKYCKEIVLTIENPYDEDPKKIITDIRSGISKENTNIHEFLDRRDAIREAIKLARTGDTVVITGKGSEPFIRLAGGKKIAWSDAEVARDLLK